MFKYSAHSNRTLRTMPADYPKGNGHDRYLAACSRVLTDVMGLVRARGILIGVDIDRGRMPDPVVHQIELTYGRRTRLISVDHDTFMDAEFFRTLVLHQLEAAIDELASSQEKSSGSSVGGVGSSSGVTFT
jgi:hypothetical protein